MGSRRARRTARTPNRAQSSVPCAGVLRESLAGWDAARSEEHTSELQSHSDLVCRLLLEKKKTGQAWTGGRYGPDVVHARDRGSGGKRIKGSDGMSAHPTAPSLELRSDGSPPARTPPWAR